MMQADLAERLNYSDKTISKWERAESAPDISSLVEIANIFDVSIDYLAGLENAEDRIKNTKKTALNIIIL